MGPEITGEGTIQVAVEITDEETRLVTFEITEVVQEREAVEVTEEIVEVVDTVSVEPTKVVEVQIITE